VASFIPCPRRLRLSSELKPVWTCPTCRERIEDQFDSCRKCAGRANIEPVKASPVSQKPRWFNYLIAGAVAYASTVGTFFLCNLMQSLSAGRGVVEVPEARLWFWLALPAAITFILVLPFLRFPVARRLVLVCVCLGWVILVSTLGRAKTRGDEANLSRAFEKTLQATPLFATWLYQRQTAGAPEFFCSTWVSA
jgi:hypothetical protein